MATYALIAGKDCDLKRIEEGFLRKNKIDAAVLSAPASVFYEKDDEIIKSVMDLMNVQKSHYVIRLNISNEDNFVKAALNDGIDCIIYNA